jgi:hypothetical protein
LSLNQGFGSRDSAVTSNFESSYSLAVQDGYYMTDHTLYLSVSPSVRDYYSGSSHTMINEMDYVKYVTPGAVQSIADNIRKITNSTPYGDEAFANAVLMMVHEITYFKSNAKYPVETLVDNQADCDGLSILAASIMKAGGLDVVLLLYNGISPPHMNIGVSLKQMPVSHSWWTVPSGIEYDNVTYWVAECTSLAEWTVGDRPRLLSTAKPIVIPLINCANSSSAKVTSSLDNRLLPSSISINPSAVYANSSGERIVNVSGSVFPVFPNATVTLYVNQPGYAHTVYQTMTDEFGNYAESWNVTLPGTYIMRTSWSGSLNYSGSDSDAITVFIGAPQPVIVDLSNGVLDNGPGNLQSQANSPWYITMFNQGSKEFLKNNLTGTNVVLSGDFMVLSDGHELTPNDTTITIPAHRTTYRLPRSSRTVIVQVPEQVLAVPGVELLNSQFGFILRQNGAANYTASVKTLSDDELAQITQSMDDNNAIVINASSVATKNTWHQAVARIVGDTATVELYDENGVLLDNSSQTRSSQNSDELCVLMTYQTGQIIAFKNLMVEAVTQVLPPTTQNMPKGNGFEFLYPYVSPLLLLAGVVLAIVGFWQRRRSKNRGNVARELS